MARKCVVDEKDSRYVRHAPRQSVLQKERRLSDSGAWPERRRIEIFGHRSKVMKTARRGFGSTARGFVVFYSFIRA